MMLSSFEWVKFQIGSYVYLITLEQISFPSGYIILQYGSELYSSAILKPRAKGTLTVKIPLIGFSLSNISNRFYSSKSSFKGNSFILSAFFSSPSLQNIACM